MSKKTDFIKNAITTHLAPMLVQGGFYRYKPKHFVRIRGEIVDSIGFQLSQWGSRNFYIHRYVNLLSNPRMNIDSYQIGNRIDHSPYRDANWIGSDENTASLALQSVAKVVSEEMLPWFDAIETIRDYIVEYVATPGTKLESLDLTIALIHTGTTDRAWWTCAALADEKNYSSPLESYEREQMLFASELQAAINTHTQEQLLNKWRRANIDKFNLGAVISQQAIHANYHTYRKIQA